MYFIDIKDYLGNETDVFKILQIVPKLLLIRSKIIKIC